MSYIEQTFCCEDFPACGHAPDHADRQRTKHALWLCTDCAPEPTAAPHARGTCEGCGRYSYVTHLVTPKPRREAHGT